MSTHLGSIGLHSNSREELLGFVRGALLDSVCHKCGLGQYYQWSSGEGAEVWNQFDGENIFIGLTPFFRGKSEFVVRLTASIKKPDDNLLEGAVHGWALPADEGEEPGLFPLVFDLVDVAVYGELPFPFVSPIRLSAFADNLQIFGSEEDYRATRDGKVKLASKSFFPTGLMPRDSSYSGPPPSIARFVGHILEFKKLKNALTEQGYYWILVETLGGSVDVVAELELVNNTLRVGGIVSGEFWLCGQIIEPIVQEKKSFWKRLFG